MAITNGALPLILERSSTLWPNDMVAADFVPQIDTLYAIRDQQTARLQTVNLPDGVDVRVAWMNNCDITVDTYDSTDCTFSGSEADVDKQDLSIDQAKESTFSVPIDAWRDNIFGFADAVSVNLNKVMVKQAEAIASYCIGVINSNLGENTYNNDGNWTLNSTLTEVPAGDWSTTDIFGHFQIASRINRFDNPFLLSGQNMYQLAYMARTSQGNGEGKGDFVRINEMPIYNDIINVDTVNSDRRTYMINRGTLAFASKGYYPTRPENLNGNFQRFSITNRFFPQLVHDVETLVDCVSGVWKQHWKVIPRYKLFVNPTGCTATRTGLLAFVRTAGV